jgi:molybdopterin-guanine dinucleotide biosynthesis protein A
MTDPASLRRHCASTTAVVLAGGKGRRIGRPKAFVELGGRALIEWVLEPLRDLFPEVLIVSTDAEPFTHLGIRVVADTLPGRGALGGAFTGLGAAGLDQVLIVGCDMPFLCRPLLAHLATHLGEREAVVPRAADGLHPLHAVYAKRSIEVFSRTLGEGITKFMRLLSRLDAVEVGEEEMRRFDQGLHSLFNLNSPEDLDQARKMLDTRVPSKGRRVVRKGER